MKKIKKINIAKRKIGIGEKPFIVAELSANHNGSLKRALDTVLSAKKSGADAIKQKVILLSKMVFGKVKHFMICMRKLILL